MAAAAVATAALGPAAGFAQVKAFPEAEGFGQFATGARTNLAAASVYHVTNLNNSGAGSFRDAVSQSNRFVVFDVGGIINISSVIPVSSNITIAGQTAPGGVTIYNNRVSFTSANNLISRYLAVRKGTASGRDDSASLARGTNMMFDHMSVTWGVDETLSMNPDSGYVIDNITIQNTIIGQGLDVVGHSAGGLMTLGEGSRFSVIKSLFADSVTRNPKVRGENEFINNVVYGWETAAYIMGDTVNMTSHANAIGNYFIEGPVDGSSPFTSGSSFFHIYGEDNWVDTNRNGVLDGVPVTSYPGANVVASPFAFPTTASMTAQQALTHVLDNVGLSLIRNPVDTRIIDEVKSYGTLGGVIVRESDLFPNFGTDPQYVNLRARLTDADNDGIADNWETAHGLSSSNGSDWKNLNGGYARLEEYINELAAAGTTRNTAGGAWTSAANWGGTLPTLADTAIATGGITHASGNAFARRATLDGSSTVSGGTLDVFDTLLVGAAAAGTLTISGGTVTPGQVVLGATGQSGSLILNGGTLHIGQIVSGGGTASLTLNGGTIKATGTSNIAVPTTVGAAGATINTNGFGASITGGLFGTGTLTKIGGGTLTLGGNNSGYSGGINLNAGAISLGTSAVNSSTGTITAANGTQISVMTSGASTPLALASGATVTITAGGVTNNGAISGAAGTTLTVSTTTTGNFTLAGSFANFSGTLDFAGSSGNIRLNASGANGSSTANFDLGDSTGAMRTAFAATVNLGSLTGAASTKLQGATNDAGVVTYVVGANGNSTTFAGSVTDGVFSTPGVVNFTKAGSGTLTLSNAASTYTGATTVKGGVLGVATLANGGLPSGTGQSSAAAANLVLDGGTLRYTGAAGSSDRAFTLTASGGAIERNGSGNFDFVSAVDVAQSGAGDRTLTLGGTSTAFSNFYAGLGDPASGKTSLTKGGSGTWRLFGAPKSYSGDTIVNGGALYLPIPGVLPSGAGKGDVIVNAGATLEMYGNSHGINGLSGVGTVTTTINTTRTLTIGNGDADGNFGGTLTQGPGQTLNLVKSGAGVQTLSGNLLYTGTTTVSGGKLVLASKLTSSSAVTVQSSATLELAAGSGAIVKTPSIAITVGGTLDVRDNNLIVTAGNAGTASAGTYNGLQGDVQRAYNFGAWDGPGLTTSMPLALAGITTIGVATGEQIRGLGPTDTDTWGGETINGASVIAMYTYAGDANLDGQVDAGDYGILDAFIQVAGATGYGNGDFNYDGFIDPADYGTIDNTIQFQGAPFPTSASTAALSNVSAVPEPAACGFALFAALLARRHRRQRCIQLH